jgi:hypothetical protein
MSHPSNGESMETEHQLADQSATDEALDHHMDPTSVEDNIFQTDEDIERSQQVYEAHGKSDRRSSEYSLDTFDDHPSHKRVIEITLHADSEFFNLLTEELSSIDDLQARQKDILTSQVNSLDEDVRAVTRPSNNGSACDLYVWRDVFGLYREASVFFSTKERDHGARNAEQARERVEWFSNQLQSQNLV